MDLSQIPARMLVSVNKEKLYERGNTLTCPLCFKDHYILMRDIYKKDKMFAQQFKRLSEDIREPKEYVSDRCQFCKGGNLIPLQVKVHGLEFKRA